ncbi:hypothetical protein AYI70_g11440 [Smittium culicis]|uniref:Uncharacterized protein n=1 Tax=Smittium culicis TaxID=133412 RepID=A0A1R1X1S2_9FUNG|nr:hypothetical protein AYI70_g11440 [Smittium culicis]
MLSNSFKTCLILSFLSIANSQSENNPRVFGSYLTWNNGEATNNAPFGTCFYFHTNQVVASSVVGAEVLLFSDTGCRNLMAKRDICGSAGFSNNLVEFGRKTYSIMVNRKDNICKYKRRH